MLLFYGERIWDALLAPAPVTVHAAVGSLAEIAENTIYSLIIIQISAAAICFALAVPFFTFLGYGHVILFSTIIGLAMLVPLIGSQFFLLVFLLTWLRSAITGARRSLSLSAIPCLSGLIIDYEVTDGETGGSAPGLHDDRHPVGIRSWGWSASSSDRCSSHSQ